ncbi:MAG TPA: hypothetical protein V6C95_10790 [Coleofasciculaceae cyanobacterium]
MTELIGIIIFAAFGLIATIAETEPTSNPKKLSRKSRSSRHHK